MSVARVLLLILDGAGLDDPKPGNAVTFHTMPTWFNAMAKHGFATLEASGKPVGLDEGQVGNSEVGHLTIGAGFIIPSTLSRIHNAYRDGTWSEHPLWRQLASSNKLHIAGLLSDAGVHGHIDSIVQSATIAQQHGIKDIVVHPVLDGLDSQAGTARALMSDLRAALGLIKGARIGIVMGRRWFCDRSGNLDFTRTYVTSLTGSSEPPFYQDEVLDSHLAKASEASFTARAATPNSLILPGEPILLTQHRADRATQIARVFNETNVVVSLIELGDDIPQERVFFPTQPLTRGLGFEFKGRNLRSVRISERCKFPHVTYFLNGLNQNLEGTPICIDTIAEAEFGDHPEMSIAGVKREILRALNDPCNQVVIANIPNLDQVGHLGEYEPAARAAQHVDEALGVILESCREARWTAMVISDHGNADRTIDDAGRPFGSHTERPVPLTVIPAPGTRLRWTAKHGSLANVAPTLLAVLGFPRPNYMVESLIEQEAAGFTGIVTKGAA